jgi:hypothetical protein
MQTTLAHPTQGLSPRTRALITGYTVAAPPVAQERTGLSPDIRALIHRYVAVFRSGRY